MTSPFDYIKSINSGKNIIDSEETEKQYNPYMTNKSFSYFLDTILQSNQMNMNYDLDKKLQYDYLLNSIRVKVRYSKWKKKPIEDENIEFISEHYKVNKIRAKEYLYLMTEEDIKTIKRSYEKGGVTK